MKPDPLETCPYDEAHRIRASGKASHIAICKRNHADSDMVHCPFDACHVVERVYYEKHVANCASSGNVRNYKYSLEPQREVGTVPLEELRNLSVPITENWDEEHVESYDPYKGTENRPVIRYLVVAPKSKKKKFRLAERGRFRRLLKKDFIECDIITVTDRLYKLKLDNIQDYNFESKLVESLSKLKIQNPGLTIDDIEFYKLHISRPGHVLRKTSISDIENILRKKLEELTLHSLSKHIPSSRKSRPKTNQL